MSHQITLSVSSTMTGTGDLSSSVSKLGKTYSIAFADGVGANQADQRFDDTREILASATDDLDLAGVLTNSLNQTVTFVKVKAIVIAAASANTNNVVIGNAATNAFVGPFGAATHTLTLGPGDVQLITRRNLAGLGVTAGTGDKLRIANSGAGTSVFYDVIIFGTTA